MADYCLIADFFYGDFTGGAELNDYSVIQQFKKHGIDVDTKYCKEITKQYLVENSNTNFIVANFVTLPPHLIDFMSDNNKYVIYEHDHKYLKRRNPIFYKNYLAPKEELANIKFYKNAKKVICLTQLAVDVLRANTGLNNVVKIGASVWRDEDLDYILELIDQEKNDKFAVMDSNNPIKKRQQCIDFCNNMNLKFDLIKDPDHREFLKLLSHYKGLVFMTGHLETCCRLLVEAKMVNCEIKYQKKLIGAASEDWFELNGEELIKEIRKISNDSVKVFMESFE